MGIPDTPREIRLVHGDDDAKVALKVVFEQALKAKPESRVVIAE
jgi:metallo-beta-lactamase family protein